MKKKLLIFAFCMVATVGFAQCSQGYEVKAENNYTNYNVRYACNPKDAKHYTTDRLRNEFAIEKVFAPNEVNWTYTMFDRFLIGGAEPTNTPSAPSCIISAASAGVATPPAAKLTTGSLLLS